jgi:hypothetical protein
VTPENLAAARLALGRDLTIDIETMGAKTRRWRTTEIWFTRVGGEVYICGTPGAGERERERAPRDWLANLIANPEFRFVLKESAAVSLPARAVRVTDEGERRRVFSAPEASWYRDQTRSIDALVAYGPLVRVEFTGVAAELNVCGQS